MTQEPRCPIAGMVPFEREFLAQCHAEAHQRSVKAGEPPVPCVRCGRDYPKACAPRRVLARLKPMLRRWRGAQVAARRIVADVGREELRDVA